MGGGAPAMTPVLERFRTEKGLTGEVFPQVTKTGNRQDLAGLFAALGYQKGAEIGVWAGAFSEVLCKAIPGVQLTCVDPWQAYKTYRERKNNQRRLDIAYSETIARLQPFRATVWRMMSLEAAAQIPDGSLDFVYIDANHQEPFISQDLAAWAPKVRSGGIVAGHDYHFKPKHPFLQQVKPAVDAFTRAHRIAPWYVLAAEKAPSYFWVVS
jgi:hypothetical protein